MTRGPGEGVAELSRRTSSPDLPSPFQELTEALLAALTNATDNAHFVLFGGGFFFLTVLF